MTDRQPEQTDRDALLDFLDKSFEEPVISPVTYRAFRPQIVSMLDRIATEPPALDVDVLAAVNNLRRVRLVGPPHDRHLESGTDGHLVELHEVRAILAETER